MFRTPLLPLPTLSRSFVAALLAAITLGGCDTVSPGGDTVRLTVEIEEDADGSPVAFSFAGTTPTGRLVDVRCGCAIDLGPWLTTQGFSRSDVVTAEVASARLVMGTPPTGTLAFLDQANLKLEAQGLSATEVANRSAFPSAREAALTVLPGRNVAAFVERPAFEPVLQIDASSLQATAGYQLYLVLTLHVTVSGL